MTLRPEPCAECGGTGGCPGGAYRMHFAGPVCFCDGRGAVMVALDPEGYALTPYTFEDWLLRLEQDGDVSRSPWKPRSALPIGLDPSGLIAYGDDALFLPVLRYRIGLAGGHEQLVTELGMARKGLRRRDAVWYPEGLEVPEPFAPSGAEREETRS